MHLCRSSLCPLIAFVVALLTLSAVAQPVIEAVPEDAAVYIGWRGADDMGPSYEGSNMQGVMEQTGLYHAFPELFSAIRGLVASEGNDPEALAVMDDLGVLWSAVWDNGGALYMLPPDDEGAPIPRMALLFGKGENDREVRQALSSLAEMINEADQVPAFVGERQEAFYLSFVFDAGQAVGRSLAQDQRFTQALGQVQSDAALIAYVDLHEWIFQIDLVAQRMSEANQQQGLEAAENPAELWPALRDTLGLDQARSLVLSAGIGEDGNWHTRLFLHAPAPRDGLTSILDRQPITAEHLLHIPVTATHARAQSLDAARVMDLAREVLAIVEPEMVEALDQGLAEIEAEIGVDVEGDLVRGLGPVWSLYVDPMIAGNGFGSVVMVNDLRDAEAVEAALIRLTEVANAVLMDEQGADEQINIRMLTRVIDGERITHLGIPFISPCWMVHDGKLYLSLYTQGLEMALEQSGEAEDSILANEAFQQTMARFLAEPVGEGQAFDSLVPTAGLSFSNLPETVADGYGMTLMLMQMFTGASEMFSGRASSALMPPVGRILPFIRPAGAITWFDEQGLHMHGIQPFPGSSMFSATGGLGGPGVGIAALTVSVTLPALGAARRTARRMQSATQIRGFIQANHMFAQVADGRFTQDIALLYSGDFVTREYFFSPEVGDLTPAGFDRWDVDDAEQFMRENSSYILVPLAGPGQVDEPSETIMVFEHPAHFDEDGLTLGFVDGSTRYLDRDEALLLIQEQTGMTVTQLIMRQQNFEADNP